MAGYLLYEFDNIAADAAKILKISKSMMYQRMKRGEIPTVRYGRSVRVRAEDLEQFIEDKMKLRQLF